MSNNKAIEVENICFSIDKKRLLHDISFSIENKEFVGIIGPNGSGKSTLLKNIYKQYEPESGSIFIDSESIDRIKHKDLARKLAVVMQESDIGFDFSVWEMMQTSRLPYMKMLNNFSDEDIKKCEDALEKVGMLEMKERSFLSLSGGEKQRVFIAMAFAQETDIIILDEPTNHLDLGYQIMLMDLLRKESHYTTFTSFHDMNLAFRYCDRIIVLNKGRIVATGRPEEIITEELLRDVFRIDAKIYPATDDIPMHIVVKNYVK